MSEVIYVEIVSSKRKLLFFMKNNKNKIKFFMRKY